MTYPPLYTPTYQADSASGSFEIDVTGFPVIPPAVPWRFLLALPQPDGTILGEVTQAQTRSLTLRAGPTNFHEASLDIDGYSPTAQLVAELQADLQVMYGPQLLAVLRTGGVTDPLTASAYRCQPTFMDYRQVLRRRSLAEGGGPAFTNADIADIAWDLIQAGAQGDPGIQSYPGGNLGIARGVGRAGLGITASIDYARTQFVGAAIDDLCQLTPGSDWDITPYGQADLRLDMWSPARGNDNGVVLTWGDGKVASITRTTDPSAYANAVCVTGAKLSGSTTVESQSDGGTISNIASWSNPSPGVLDVADSSWAPGSGQIKVHASGHTNAILSYTGTSAGGRFTGCQYISGSPSGTVSTGNSVDIIQLSPDVSGAPDIASRLEGRWDQVIGTQHQIQSSMDKAAAWYLQNGQVILPTYTITLHPGAWQGPNWLFLGDLVTVRISAGRLQVDDKLPVTEMTFDINSSGMETLTMTVGRIPYRIHQQIPKMLQRLRLLETQ